MKNVASCILSIVALIVLVSCGGGDPGAAGKDVPPTERAAAKKVTKKAKRKRAVKRSDELVDLMPPDSIVFFHLPDFSHTREAFTNTALYKIFEEREVQRALAEPIEAIENWIKQVRLHEGVDLSRLLKEIDGETAIAATRDHVFAAIELGDAYLAAHRLVRQLGQPVFELEKLDGTDVFTARSLGEGRSAMKLKLCFRDGRLIAALGEGALERVLDGYESLLSKSELYNNAVEIGFEQRADYRLFVDLQQLVSMLEDEGGPEARGAIETFDLDALTSLVMAGYMDGREFFDRIALVTNRKEHFFSRLLRSGKPTEEMLACVPDTCESLSFVRLDLKWLPAFAQQVAASFDETVAAGIGRGIEAAEATLGMPLPKFIDALGESWFLMSVDGADEEGDDGGPLNMEQMLATSGISGTILAIQMKEPELVRAALTHLANARPEVSTVRVGKCDGFAVEPPRMSSSGPAIAPHAVLRDNLLIIAADRKGIYRYLERDGQSILRNPTFEYRWRGMPDTICGLGYTDLRPSMSRLLEVAHGFLPFLARMGEADTGMPFELQLPDAEVINRHLTPITTSCELLDRGVVLDSRSPVGSITVMVPVIAVASAIAIPNLLEARERANREPEPTGRPPDPRRPRTEPARPVRPISTGRPPDDKSPKFGNEHSTLYVLKTMVRAQEMFRESANIDVDRDGVGEYGTFAELSGSVRLRGSIRSLDPPILTANFGRLEDGLLRRRGYFFRLFLPGPNGLPRPERPNGGAASNLDADLAESHWCVVAWPVDESSGARSFYVDQKGIVFESRFPYRGQKKPLRLGSILQKREDLRSGPTLEGPAADGSRWDPVR